MSLRKQRIVDGLRALGQLRIGLGNPPGFMGHAAQRDTPTAIWLDNRRDRDQRKGVRGAIADFTVDVLPTHGRRQGDGGNQFTWRQDGFDMGRFPWGAIKVGEGDVPRFAVGRNGFHHCIQQTHRDRHIARMRSNTGLAAAHHRMLTAKPLKRRATAAGKTFIAGLIGIVKIGAAGTLKKIPCRGGLVA